MTKELFDEIVNKYHTDQCREEMWLLIEKLNVLQPANILEVGIEYGGSGMVWSYFSDKNQGHYLGIENLLNRVTSDLINKERVTIIEGLSFAEDVVSDTVDFLDNNEFDFIFLDGSHDIKDVYADIKNFWPLLKKGGILAIHDVANDKDGARIGLELAKKDGILNPTEDGFLIINHGTYWSVK